MNSAWNTSTLGDTGDWLSGGTPSKQEADLWAGPVPWVSPKDMKRPRLADATDHVAEHAVGNGTQMAPIGSILMVVRGMILAHTFPVALTTAPLTFNQDIKALVPGTGWSSEFLFYWLQNKAPEVLQLVDVANHGTKRLPSERLFALSVPRPSLPEQCKIAAILSSVDDAIEATQAVIDQLQVVKKAMMAELLTRGLPGRHTRFKQTEIGEVPEEWKVRPLRECTERVTDGTHQSPNFTNDGIPFLLVKSISAGRVRWDETNFVSEQTYQELTRNWRPARGDVLYTAVGATYGVAIPVDFDRSFTFQRHIAHIRPSKAEVRSQFLAHFLNSSEGKRQADLAAVGNAQPTVTLRSLAAFIVPLPTVQEQAEIESILISITSRLETEQAVQAGLVALKAALLSALLSGEIRVIPDEAPL